MLMKTKMEIKYRSTSLLIIILLLLPLIFLSVLILSEIHSPNKEDLFPLIYIFFICFILFTYNVHKYFFRSIIIGDDYIKIGRQKILFNDITKFSKQPNILSTILTVFPGRVRGRRSIDETYVYTISTRNNYYGIMSSLCRKHNQIANEIITKSKIQLVELDKFGSHIEK